MFKKAAIIFLLLLLGACLSDAPRENPFDSGDGFSLTGQVSSFYGALPIAGALITLIPGNRSAVSDQNGFFNIIGIPEGQYSIDCLATAYAPISTTLQLKKASSLLFQLDALPIFQDIHLRTRHISRFFPAEDEFYIAIGLRGSDPDDPLQALQCYYTLSNYNYTDTLRADSTAGNFFSGRLDGQDLGIASIKQLIGKPFRFYLRDAGGSLAWSEDHFLTRVIDTTPVVAAPVGDTLVSTTFNFEWDLITQSYPFTYSLEVYEVLPDSNRLLVQIDELLSGTTRFTYNTPPDPPLPINQPLFWVLYIVDEFGNNSRSKPGIFSIGPDKKEF